MFATQVSTKGVVTIGRDGRGTGFVPGSPGRAVTNAHHLRASHHAGRLRGWANQATVVGIDAEVGSAARRRTPTTHPMPSSHERAGGRRWTVLVARAPADVSQRAG